jgi:hypothetical protein
MQYGWVDYFPDFHDSVTRTPMSRVVGIAAGLVLAFA